MDGEDFKHNYHTAQAIYCIICQKKRKKQEQKTVKQVNETFFSRQNSRKCRGMNDNNDSDEESEPIFVRGNRVLTYNKKMRQIGGKGQIASNSDDEGFIYTQQERNKSGFSI